MAQIVRAGRRDRRGLDRVVARLARGGPALFLLGCAGAAFALAQWARRSRAAPDRGGSAPPTYGSSLTLNPTPIEADLTGAGILPAGGPP